MKNLLLAVIILTSNFLNSQIELVQNGSFELGESSWDFSLAANAYGDIGYCLASEGDNYLWFGDLDELTGSNNIDFDEVVQDVQLPANLNYAEFSFYWSGGSDEQNDVDEYDFMYFGLFDANGDEIYSDSISNADIDVAITAADCDPLWYLEGFTIPSQFAGQTVSIVFAVFTDDLYPTLFRVDEVSVLAFTTSGVEESMKLEMQVSPNPVEDQLTITRTSDNELPLIITDINGKILLNQFSNSLITHIDVSNFQSGVYFVTSSTGIQQKFIKK